MFSFSRSTTLFTLLFLVALVAGYWLAHTASLPEKSTRASDEAHTPARAVTSPQNKPLHRSANHSTTRHHDDELPAFTLANERIILFKTDADYQKFLASLDARGLKRLGQSDRLRAVRVGLGAHSNLDDIEGAESGYNYLVTIPEPPQASAQAGATGFGMNALSWLGVTGDNSSWGKGITVAVIDSGVNNHIALKGSITQIELTELSEGAQQLGHGTAVASIISGDHRLTQGVAPDSDILSIRVTDESGTSNSFTLAEGIVQAVDAGASVINISMGSYGDSAVVANAVEYATQHAAVIVAASGNEGLSSMAYPAAYENVIAVGAVEYHGDHLDFSNSGESLNVTAPGYEVNAAWGNEQLTAFSGTSASTPFISGAIAATLSEFPHLNAQQAADLVIATSNDAGYPGSDPDYGAGILDLGRIMNHDTAGIYDVAIAGQILISPETAATLPEVWVTIQNQGTENLINSPVSITTPRGTSSLNISSLTPGQIQTFKIPLQLPYNGDPITITSTVQSNEPEQDRSNNSRSDDFSKESP